MSHTAEDQKIFANNPQWDKYRGSPPAMFEIPYKGIKLMGGISFRAYLGKSLSDILWEDLVYILQPEYLGIIEENEAECLVTMCNSVIIYLDADDKVKDIYYTPPVF